MDRFGAQGRGISSGALMGRIATQERAAKQAQERALNPSPIRIAQLQHRATAEGIPTEHKAAAIAKLAALGIAPLPRPARRTYRYGDPR